MLEAKALYEANPPAGPEGSVSNRKRAAAEAAALGG